MFFQAFRFMHSLQKWNALIGREIFPLTVLERVTAAIEAVTDVESAKRHCVPAWGYHIFDSIERSGQVAETWLRFLIHLCHFVDGKEIVKCFAKEHAGCMTYCVMLTAHLHPTTEELVYEFFKTMLGDARGEIIALQEIKGLAEQTRRNIAYQYAPTHGLCSYGCCEDLKPGAIKDWLLGLGCLAISRKFRDSMQRDPEATIAKVKALQFSETSALNLISSL
jgi:hypothetical protein